MPTGVYPRGKTIAQRFWEKVIKTETCWLWVATTATAGYGTFRVQRRSIRAHRWAYEQLVGPIPKGLVTDHLCRVRRCVNPAHIELVTIGENVLRGNAPSARQARQTHCKRGHELSVSNIYMYDGARICRACTSWRGKKKRGTL